jgi:hypothetical protein
MGLGLGVVTSVWGACLQTQNRRGVVDRRRADDVFGLENLEKGSPNTSYKLVLIRPASRSPAMSRQVLTSRDDVAKTVLFKSSS